MTDDKSAEASIRSRVRARCRGGDSQDIARQLRELGHSPAALPHHADPRIGFLANVLNNHGDILGAADRSAAVACIGEYIADRHGRRKVVAGKDPRLAALPWREGGVLPRFGLIENGDSVGVSYARRAIAETGSIILEGGRDNPVSNSLLPEDHIVLVDSTDVVARLDDAWPGAGCGQERRGPRCLQIISGPSSTADIALNMVYGAHGPGSWLVILIGSDAPAFAGAAARLSKIRAQATVRS